MDEQQFPPAPGGSGGEADHRVLMARKKRESMRMRILEATMHVYARTVDDAPVIEDVVREAGIARGTFYKYFDSLDQALVAAGTEANDRMIADILSVYDCLQEPWQRSSVGFRVYMVRALQDPQWVAFVMRMEAWSRDSVITRYMGEDFRRGKALGQFVIDDVAAAVDFFKGASLGCVFAMRQGVPDPEAYMDAAVGMAMWSLGCSADMRARAVAFSRKHLNEWCSSGCAVWTPL